MAASSKPNPKRFLVPKEAADIVGMSTPALYKRIRFPKTFAAPPPPFVRRGRRVLLPTEEFMKWAAQKVIE